MLLCDIGNTSYHFFDSKKDFKEDVDFFNPSTLTEDIYYICVNPQIKQLLNTLPNWIDLAQFVDMSKYYETIGIDRIMACEAIDNGVIVDAGSAITVDIVKDGIYCGGFIYPGIRAMEKTYNNISSVLDYSFNFECDLNTMPKNSRDSISYGYLKLLFNEVISYDMKIFLTGGDANFFIKIFPNAKVDERLIFKGMNKIIKRKFIHE